MKFIPTTVEEEKVDEKANGSESMPNLKTNENKKKATKREQVKTDKSQTRLTKFFKVNEN